MKVLIVSPGYPRWKGDYTHPMVRNVARQLTNAGHQVKVITIAYPNVPSREVAEGIEVIRARYAPAKLQLLGSDGGIIDDIRNSILCKLLLIPMLASLAFQTLVNARWANLLLVQWVPTSVVVLPARWLFKKRLVIHSRTYADTPFWRTVYRFLLARADGVIYNSSDNQKHTQELFRHPHTTVIGSGINLAQYEKIVRGVRCNGVLQIISVARLVEFKGVEYAIRAIALLKERGKQAKLTVVGDGPLRSHLEKLIESLGVQDQVSLAGALPHDKVVEQLSESDVFVLSSIVDSRGRTEAFGAAILEAMAAQVPVIASAVGGILDIMNDSNGVLVPEKNEHALADAIEFVLSRPEAAQTYIANAYKFVHANYSDEAITRRYTTFLTTVIGNGARQ